MDKTGIVRDEFYKRHDMGAFHPESPRRLEVIYSMLDDDDIRERLVPIASREASEEEITSIHTPEYYRLVAGTAASDYLTPLDPDTSACRDTFEAALLAAGGLLELVEAVQENRLPNGFALVRPPGHHAEAGFAMGFCIFNNLAIAASRLISHYGLDRVLIVDWDLHHGNGTQHSFYGNHQVLYFSTHQSPYYPGTGSFEETGTGRGKGYTVNVPLYPGAGDYDYVMIFKEILQPLAREFKPDFILVSAGFDTHFSDPLGSMRVTPQGYAGLTRMLLDSADELCQGRLVLTLEGGYSLEALRQSVKAVLLELSEGRAGPFDMTRHQIQKSSYEIDSVIQRVKAIQKEFWNCF
ncbi:MAG: histone deacetylase [Deltaproteobacteria bacterium]|nr:histone deacetylase [Deltaproteobacteria bacterium]